MFTNLQQRNIIEPRTKKAKSVAKTKQVQIYSKKKEWHDMEKKITKDLD